MDKNIVNIRFFDCDINFIGEVDIFTSLFYISKWETYGQFEMHFKSYNNRIKKGNYIMLNNNPNLTGIIEYINDKTESLNKDITVKGFSLGYLLFNRATVPEKGLAYQSFNNMNIEDIMIGLVNANAINPMNINRKIPHLVASSSKHRGIKLNFQSRFRNLTDELTKLSKVSGLGWNIALDYKNKRFVFNVLEGLDLTTNQTINPPKIFSLKYDNILKQEYTTSNIGYKNMAYVLGQGEGAKREIITLNDDLKALERCELVVDARDIEDGSNLSDRGKIKLAENKQINSFECEVDSSDYRDTWNLGDLVTAVNVDWNVVQNDRVAEVKETWENSEYKVEPTFGTPIPTPMEKLKEMNDNEIN